MLNYITYLTLLTLELKVIQIFRVEQLPLQNLDPSRNVQI